MRADEAADEERQELHGAARDLQVLGAEGVDAEGLDDDGGEGSKCRVGDLGARRHDE